LLRESQAGHVDIPRLRQGNVAVQGFGVVTKFTKDYLVRPASIREDRGDLVPPLVKFSAWSSATHRSLLARALHQAEMLQQFASQSEGTFWIIKTRKDLEAFLEERRSKPTLTAGFLGLEGAHALEEQVEHVEILFNAGFCMQRTWRN
jgi:membrane dipeptidase